METNKALEINSPALWMPATAKDAWELKQQFGTAGTYIAGGTLIQTNWSKGEVRIPNLISLDGINELHGIRQETVNGVPVIRIGAFTTLNDCLKNRELLRTVPLLAKAIKKIAAPAVRNRGTIGGNIASQVGDSIAVLLALNASLLLFDKKKYIHTSLSQVLQSQEPMSDKLLICIYIPIWESSKNEKSFYKKIGYREAFSPSVVTVSGYFLINYENQLSEIVLAAGDAITPTKRLLNTEQTLLGEPISNQLLHEVYREIVQEYTPKDGKGASIDYRKRVTANIIVSEIARLSM